MNRFGICKYLAALYLFAVIPCLADPAALPLANHVPDDAVVYIGWAGSDALQPAYDASHLKAVLSASNFADVLSQLIPQLENKITDPESKDSFALAQQVGAVLWKHPTTLYMRTGGAVTPAKVNVGVSLNLVCDAGSDSATLLGLFQNIAKMAPQAIAGSAGNIVWLCPPEEHPDQLEHALASASQFTSVMNQLQTAPAYACYVNVNGALASADDFAANEPTASRVWPAVRDALGLTHITAYAATGGFDGPDWATSSCLLAPAPRTGLLAAIEPAPADPALLARVPDSANVISASNFDAAKFLDAIDAAFATDPQADDVFHKGLGAANMFLGRNLRRQILGPLGPQWVLYSTTPTSFIILNKPTDPAAASDGLVSAMYGLSNGLNAWFARMRGPAASPMVTIDQKTIQGVNVTTATVAAFGLMPSMAVNNGILYLGISPMDVAQAATAADVTDADITHRPGFADAAKRLNAPAVTAFRYVNLPQVAPATYARLAAGLATLRQMSQNLRIQLPPIVFPPLDQIQANLSPALSVKWADANGIYGKSITPFPGASTLLGSSPDELTTVGAAALGTSILLPALNRSRETANRVKCASNERQIGQAMLLYANDHRGNYPPDLGTLIKTEDITAQVFICPSGDTKVPPGVNTPDQIAQWVNDHSDYIYVGKGMTFSTSKPTDIILYEKPDAHHGDGMNMLYGDGHVEFQRMDMAKKLIDQQGGGDNTGEHGL
jgi:prepilin-type processing-associated H-X9-DG protein